MKRWSASLLIQIKNTLRHHFLSDWQNTWLMRLWKNVHSCIAGRTGQEGTGKMNYAISHTRKYYADVIKRIRMVLITDIKSSPGYRWSEEQLGAVCYIECVTSNMLHIWINNGNVSKPIKLITWKGLSEQETRWAGMARSDFLLYTFL